MGLRIAEQVDDVDALQWACSGVLGRAWPEQYSQIEQEARLLARATHQRLIEEGQPERAEAFLAGLQAATSHDLVVRISWTGDADIDLMVEEPSGTVCSREQPYSAVAALTWVTSSPDWLQRMTMGDLGNLHLSERLHRCLPLAAEASLGQRCFR